MAEERKIMTRIINKNASLTDWDSSSLVLKKGEIALAYVETTKPDGHGGYYTVPTYLMKVGDGQKTFKQLEFVAAPASDVYQWAKQANKPSYTATEIAYGTGSTVNAQIADLLTRMTEAETDIGTLSGGVEGVQGLINTAIQALDVDTWATEDGIKFVTAVGETDGKISVTRRALTAADIPTLEIDKINGLGTRLGNIEKSVTDEATARENADKALETAYKAADTAIGTRIGGVETRVGTLETESAKHATKTEVEGIDTRLTTAEGDITTIKGNITDINGEIADLKAADTTNLEAAKTYAKGLVDGEVERAQGKEGELAEAIAAEKARLDAFLKLEDGETLDSALDSLKELQTYITTEAAAADQMVKDIAANTKAITDNETANSTAHGTFTTGIQEAKDAAAAADTKAGNAATAAATADGKAVAAQNTIDTYVNAHKDDYTNTAIDTAVADAKKAGTDAASALNSYKSEMTTALAGKAEATHTHAQSEVTGLTTALEGKADKTHTHAQSEITGLVDALAGKVDDSEYATDKAAINKAITDGDTALSGRITTLENKKVVEYGATNRDIIYVFDCGGITD